MSTGKKVFIVGPGFIGWNVLDLLIAEKYTVTALVRRESHATQIQTSGAHPIMGDLHDGDLITATTTEHDIVIHTATADDLPSVRAVLAGIQARADNNQSTIFIHTSGTSVLDDNVMGAHKSSAIYHDNVRDEVDSVAPDAPHRTIDSAIVNFQTGLGPRAKLAIMIPPLIYGYNPAHDRLTIQIPTLTRFALKHGFSGHVGPGLSVESNIHVRDLARAYIVLLHHLEASPAAATLSNPYYFCETTGDAEPSWRDVAAVIGEGLHAAGRLSDPTPKPIPKELYEDVFGEYTGAVLGLNSRSRAVRLRELGWNPVEKGWRESYLEDELPVILKEETGNFSGYKGAVAS